MVIGTSAIEKQGTVHDYTLTRRQLESTATLARINVVRLP